MIVSLHIPKTAGKSFRWRLEATYGARIMSDYRDWVGLDVPEARAQRAEQAAKMLARRDKIAEDYDLIYGQFVADKYAGVFPTVDFTAFVRDPYQQAVSHYQFLLRHDEIQHPWVVEFRRVRPSLAEFLAVVPDFQSLFLGSVAVDDFAMVGIAEDYERSVALFGAMFGRKIAGETARANVNPDRAGDHYAVDPEVQKAVAIYRARDIELYRRGQEIFSDLCARYDV